MPTRDTIVIGASAGGVEALSKLVLDLPSDFQAAVFIVLHIPANAPSFLPAILSRDAQLTVAHAENGQPIERRRIYIAPPDQHLLIEDGHVKLVHGPKENLHRPSIDALFRSAARAPHESDACRNDVRKTRERGRRAQFRNPQGIAEC